MNFDFQNSSNANANRGIYFISRNVMHWLGQLNDCNNMLFTKVNKISVYILVQ